MESFFPYHCSFRPEISRLLRQCNYKLTVSDVEKGTTYLNCYRFILLLFFSRYNFAQLFSMIKATFPESST